MLKVMLLLKRRPGLSLSEFIERYEHVHAPLARKNGGKARHYERHYLHPHGRFLYDDEDDEVPEPAYDVLTELWYESMEELTEHMDDMKRHPERLAAIIADEELLFDRDKCRVTVVEDRITGDWPDTSPSTS